MIPVTTFAGRSVALFGLGNSGLATAHALLAGGATLAAWDDGETIRTAAAKADIPLVDLSTADWSAFCALILAPGVPLTHPEPHWVVHKAHAAGVEIIGDIELFCRERNAHCPAAPFIAITGTNGKSTTTALIAHILRKAGRDVQMGGNIGVPILALEPPAMNRFHVIEMSSFQIDLTPSVNPTVGVLLNITPDHLDRHGTMETYAAIKARLVSAGDMAVIGVDGGIATGGGYCDALFHQLDAHDKKPVLAFSHGPAQATNIVWYASNCLNRAITIGGDNCFVEALVDLSTATTLRGAHNAENAAAAFLSCEWLGLPHDEIGSGIKSYPGLPHRLEEIGRIGNVWFINDSKATNADSTEKALLSFPCEVFWIVGGKAKEGGIERLRPYFPGIVRAYLIGASADDFSQTLDGDAAIIPCGTLDVAVARASADAAAFAAGAPMPAYNVEGKGGAPFFAPWTSGGADKGDGQGRQPVVLLSPACASYDQFKNFEARGDQFRALVAALPGFTPRARP
jgi:UDP-N-acetylmuramoylalanine--D-glutamate ligase